MKKCTCTTLDSFIHTFATDLITMDTELCVYHHSFQGTVAYRISRTSSFQRRMLRDTTGLVSTQKHRNGWSIIWAL